MIALFTQENLNLPADHPSGSFDRDGDTFERSPATGHSRLGLIIDLSYAQIGEANPIAFCRTVPPWHGEVKVADIPGCYAPGIGEFNHARVAKALAWSGYNGGSQSKSGPGRGQSRRRMPSGQLSRRDACRNELGSW